MLDMNHIIPTVNVRTIFGHTPSSDNFRTEICLTSWTSDELGQIFFSENGTTRVGGRCWWDYCVLVASALIGYILQSRRCIRATLISLEATPPLCPASHSPAKVRTGRRSFDTTKTRQNKQGKLRSGSLMATNHVVLHTEWYGEHYEVTGFERRKAMPQNICADVSITLKHIPTKQNASILLTRH